MAERDLRCTKLAFAALAAVAAMLAFVAPASGEPRRAEVRKLVVGDECRSVPGYASFHCTALAGS